jgi:hypothetical protein
VSSSRISFTTNTAHTSISSVMASAGLDMASSLTLFQNALVYTIAASSVTAVVDTADASSTLVLVITIALVVTAAHKAAALLPIAAVPPTSGSAVWQCGICRTKQTNSICNKCGVGLQLQLRLVPLTALFHFLVATVANILLQFESTLVARLVLSTISPSKIDIEWVIMYVTVATVMMWLVKYALGSS